jgi:hypothetical protein
VRTTYLEGSSEGATHSLRCGQRISKTDNVSKAERVKRGADEVCGVALLGEQAKAADRSEVAVDSSEVDAERLCVQAEVAKRGDVAEDGSEAVVLVVDEAELIRRRRRRHGVSHGG